MKQILRTMALGFVLAAAVFWLVTGANRGWTKTSVPKKTVEDVTGIEGVTYEKKFVPGVDFLAGAVIAAGVLTGVSFLFKNKNMQKQINTILAFASLAGISFAEPQTFDFKDPKVVNTALFHLDAPLESINGSASGISGTVTFDPEKPADTKGKIVVATGSLRVPTSMMIAHLHSSKWMDATKYPELSFAVKELKNVNTSGDVTTADAVGTFTCKDVAKELTVPVKLTYLKDKLGARVPNMKGDLLVIRTNFKIKRSEFNINPGQYEDKVSDEIELTLSIAGASAK